MPDATEAAPPLNYVFVDFENVHEIDLTVIGTKTVIFTLLMGAKQTRLDAALVEKLLAHSASVQLIRLTSSGKNSLDFALAYYVGRAVNAHPSAYIHIVSGDTGFDPLVEHLRSRHIRATRHAGFADLTFSKVASVAPSAKPVALRAKTGTPPAKRAVPPAKPAKKEEPMARALKHLGKNVNNRPKKKTTLLSHLKSMIGKTAKEADAANLLEGLRAGGHLSIGDKDVVSYHLR